MAEVYHRLRFALRAMGRFTLSKGSGRSLLLLATHRAQPPAHNGTAGHPTPKSLLGRHRLLSPTAGIFLIPMCLDALNFGGMISDSLDECATKTVFEVLDFCSEQGGTFLDT